MFSDLEWPLTQISRWHHHLVLNISETVGDTDMVTMKYEGRSINKLQNDILLLIFKIWKFGNIRFVGNLISWNFYDDDVIIVTSLVLRTQSVSAVFCPAVFFYNSQVLIGTCESEISVRIESAATIRIQIESNRRIVVYSFSVKFSNRPVLFESRSFAGP